MQRQIAPLAAAAAAVLITLAATSITSRAAGSYADDRSEIEDLQARYLFAMDFHDPELYVTTFTEDGILDVGSGEIKGREAIAKRRIYNENRDEWAYKGTKNPAW